MPANKVLKFNDQGGFLTSFGNPLPDLTTNFDSPDGIATSSDSILQIYVVDTGNNRVEVFSNVPPPTITISLNTTTPAWGHAVSVTLGKVTSANQGDKISIDWADGTPATVFPVPAPGDSQFPPPPVTHVYDLSAIPSNPHKVIGKLLTSQDDERARTTIDDPGLSVTVQKHVTSLSVAVKDGSANGGICINCQFTVFGKVVDTNDTDTTPDIGLLGKTISFSGSGVPSSLNSVQTSGIKFLGAPSVTVTDNHLELPVGAEITLPSATQGVVYTFENGVDLSFTKGNDAVQTKSEPSGSGFLLDNVNGLKKITITGVSGGSVAKLVTIETGDPETGFPETANQMSINFNPEPPDPHPAANGDYPTLAIEPGSYFSTGQNVDGAGLTITAAFNDASDPAYQTSTAQVTYDAGSQFGIGEGIPTAYDGVTWTKLTVGAATAGDLCTIKGVPGADADKDGICDNSESATYTAGPGVANSAQHRYVLCPTNAGPAVMDASCPTTNGSIKYDLCFADAYAGVWGSSIPSGTNIPHANGAIICPTVGHKDLYVEIDYMSDRRPTDTAIQRVIKAFGNAPISGTADAFGNTKGITLHVIVSDPISPSPSYKVWTGSSSFLLWYQGLAVWNSVGAYR